MRGSTVALTDDNGTVTDRLSYGPYGELLSHNGNNDTPFLYNGRDGVMTDANGLYFMRARYYNPEIKRFISEDAFEGKYDNLLNISLHQYAGSNPISYIDPMGTKFGEGSDQGTGKNNTSNNTGKTTTSSSSGNTGTYQKFWLSAGKAVTQTLENNDFQTIVLDQAGGWTVDKTVDFMAKATAKKVTSNGLISAAPVVGEINFLYQTGSTIVGIPGLVKDAGTTGWIYFGEFNNNYSKWGNWDKRQTLPGDNIAG